jgi:SAM-dependent methyltransferase
MEPHGDLIASSYAAKPPGYFAGARSDLLDRLPPAPAAVILEIGCGAGGTGALALASGKCARYYGIEIDPSAAEKARDVLTDVIVGNVEQIDLPYPAASLDAIIISEVLEHLIDPWDLIERLVRLLRPGGVMIATSPNISHWRVIARLARGRFDYVDIGVMDRTHLRWFTPASFRQMFERAGFIVDYVGPLGGFGRAARLVNAVFGASARHLFCTQIALLGRKPA